MRILSIETSCDDTCLTIFEASGGTTSASFKILANNSNSQIKIHSPYGGVFPALAKREHIKNLPLLLEKTLKEAKVEKVDLIAVTYGPGLEPALWTGITFAQELAKKWKVPIIPTNHMEGHIFSPFGKSKGKFKIPKIKTPILSLLVSGGHTQLVLSKKWMQYEIIGETMDDAVGEAFDKVARMMDLPYPGGPQISKLAEGQRTKEVGSSREGGLGSASSAERQTPARNNFRENFMGAESASTPDFLLPRPMKYSKNFNFSFSGLKTAVLYLIKKIGKLDENTKAEIALEFENAAIECLTHKTARAIEKYNIKTLIVGGGVSANKHLRTELKVQSRKLKVKVLFPAPELSMDNSIMIGIAGYLNFIKNKNLPAGKAGKVPKPKSIKATGNLKL